MAGHNISAASWVVIVAAALYANYASCTCAAELQKPTESTFELHDTEESKAVNQGRSTQFAVCRQSGICFGRVLSCPTYCLNDANLISSWSSSLAGAADTMHAYIDDKRNGATAFPRDSLPGDPVGLPTGAGGFPGGTLPGTMPGAGLPGNPGGLPTGPGFPTGPGGFPGGIGGPGVLPTGPSFPSGPSSFPGGIGPPGSLPGEGPGGFQGVPGGFPGGAGGFPGGPGRFPGGPGSSGSGGGTAKGTRPPSRPVASASPEPPPAAPRTKSGHGGNQGTGCKYDCLTSCRAFCA